MRAMDIKKECITVSVRIRPVISQDNTSSSCLQIISNDPPVLVVLDRPQTYHFDYIFPEDADQKNVYETAVKPLVENVKKGYNCTVFAYGQTGTGKTYTMGTDTSTLKTAKGIGVIPRALDQLFLEHSGDDNFDAYISFAEIYNEKVFDLLQTNNKNPLPVSGFIVQGLSVKNIRDAQEAKDFLKLGNRNRHTGETKQNSGSSRSHAIFTVHYSVKNGNEEISGKLNLVDLAGSEGVKKTGSRGSTFQEGININKGLLSVGQVISALSTRSSFVPYRESVITSILQGSLNVDNYISLIACVSANPDDITETLQTLDFAQRAKKIRSNPEVNQIISKYKKEHFATFPTVRTPLKRSNPSLLMHTQSAKTKRVASQVLMPMIYERHSKSEVENSNISVESSVTSVSSSADTNCEITHQALSPVVRKYMNKMEVTLMNHLETVVRNTIITAQTPKVTQNVENKENTPGISWNKIQSEVSKLVRSELIQMTSKSIRATSSPLTENDTGKIRRILSYDSPEITEAKAKLTDQVLKTPFSFKVPKIPKRIEANESKKFSMSPIETENAVPARRSMRLSMRVGNGTLDLSDVSFSSKRNGLETSLANYSSIKADKLNTKSPDLLSLEAAHIQSKLPKEKSPKIPKRRMSVRVATKKCFCLNKSRSPKENKSKTVKTPKRDINKRIKMLENQNKDSPFSAHATKVLLTLNQGSLKEIEKLHSVGSKTAEQILLFRRLKGSLKKVDDLRRLPGWGQKKFERFVSQNFLKKD